MGLVFFGERAFSITPGIERLSDAASELKRHGHVFVFVIGNWHGFVIWINIIGEHVGLGNGKCLGITGEICLFNDARHVAVSAADRFLLFF